jgi:outer membrane protein assembly factor BamB
MVRTLGLAFGKEIQKPAPFLPANARASDPIVINNVLYAAVSGNCGDASDGVWAIDLASDTKAVTSWKTNGGSPVGPIAFATDGTLLVAIGPGKAAPGGYANAIVALDPKTLQPKDWFTDPATDLVSGPLVFTQNDRDVVTVATKDGRILLLDTKSLGGPNHATPLYASRSFMGSSATFAHEALAMWQEMIPIAGAPAAAPATPGTPAPPTMQAGARWLLVPVSGRLPADLQVPTSTGPITNGAILALRVVDEGGRLSLQPDWVSRDLTAPVTPIAVNGVVFAVSSGRPQSAAGAARGTPAVLYAMNGKTGKEIWNSGKTIASFMPGRSLWSGAGQVYVGTFDGTVYAFGFAMERK